MAKDMVEDTHHPSKTGLFSVTGRFQYQGQGALGDGAIKLLACLHAAGVKLTNLTGYSANGAFVSRGTVTFEVTGTGTEIERFQKAYEA